MPPPLRAATRQSYTQQWIGRALAGTLEPLPFVIPFFATRRPDNSTSTGGIIAVAVTPHNPWNFTRSYVNVK